MRNTTKLATYLVQGLAFLLITVQIVACGGTANTGSNGNTSPIHLQVLDGGGVTQLVKPMLTNYMASHKNVQITFLPAVTAPDVPGKLKAQEDAHKQDIGLVLTGYDFVAAGLKLNLLEKLTPDHQSNLPDLTSIYLPGAKQYSDLAQGYALPVAYTPSGPLFEYDPSKIASPPKTIDELKAWILAHPGKFSYARPRNSGPGRTMLMGLPYLLGDSDPKDPANGWSKTWAFLKTIDAAIDYYPPRTGVTMTQLGNDTRWIIATTLGWDINPRILGTVPKGFKTFTLQNTTFVADDLFMMMPRGLDQAHQSAVLDIMNWILKPDQQALDYDSGYFYPGPAVKNVTLSMAPASSQSKLQEFGRPEYDSLIQSTTTVMPVSADNLNAAFDKWDSDIGGNKVKAA